MRRTDRDGHVMRQGSPPFRVLAVPDHVYLSPVPPAEPPPPPPRAPEPYKVVPSSTSFARAHRRSSFVILAESTTVTPEPRCPSPAGRVSPFRGRGFKGPPPRSKSRSQSPEIHEAGRRRVRVERRGRLENQIERSTINLNTLLLETVILEGIFTSVKDSWTDSWKIPKVISLRCNTNVLTISSQLFYIDF